MKGQAAGTTGSSRNQSRTRLGKELSPVDIHFLRQKQRGGACQPPTARASGWGCSEGDRRLPLCLCWGRRGELKGLVWGWGHSWTPGQGRVSVWLGKGRPALLDVSRTILAVSIFLGK